MNKKTITFATLIATLGTGALIPAAASAQAGRVEEQRQISYADLDLTSAAGRDRLEQRLRYAVKQVCGSPDSRNLNEMMQVRRCREAALTQAAQGRELALATPKRITDVAAMTVATQIKGN